MIVDVLNRISNNDAESEEGAAHAALFAHVGVEDPADWRAVALRLACQYAPELLLGLEPCEPAKVARKGGRPKTRTDWHLTMVEIFVEQVREASREKRIRPGLDTDIDACKFILGTAPETKDMRDALGLKPGTSPFTLNNMLRDARKLGKRAEAHAST